MSKGILRITFFKRLKLVEKRNDKLKEVAEKIKIMEEKQSELMLTVEMAES